MSKKLYVPELLRKPFEKALYSAVERIAISTSGDYEKFEKQLKQEVSELFKKYSGIHTEESIEGNPSIATTNDELEAAIELTLTANHEALQKEHKRFRRSFFTKGCLDAIEKAILCIIILSLLIYLIPLLCFALSLALPSNATSALLAYTSIPALALVNIPLSHCIWGVSLLSIGRPTPLHDLKPVPSTNIKNLSKMLLNGSVLSFEELSQLENYQNPLAGLALPTLQQLRDKTAVAIAIIERLGGFLNEDTVPLVAEVIRKVAFHYPGIETTMFHLATTADSAPFGNNVHQSTNALKKQLGTTTIGYDNSDQVRLGGDLPAFIGNEKVSPHFEPEDNYATHTQEVRPFIQNISSADLAPCDLSLDNAAGKILDALAELTPNLSRKRNM